MRLLQDYFSQLIPASIHSYMRNRFQHLEKWLKIICVVTGQHLMMEIRRTDLNTHIKKVFYTLNRLLKIHINDMFQFDNENRLIHKLSLILSDIKFLYEQ